MMKSEWDPLKTSKPELKQRLNSLFGRFDQYSEFAIKSHAPGTPKQISPASTSSPPSNGDGDRTTLQNTEEQYSNEKSELHESDVNSSRNNLDAIRMIPEKNSMSKEPSPNNNRVECQSACKLHSSRGLRSEIKAFLQQITFVAPLLSPIRSPIPAITNADEQASVSRKRPRSNSPQTEDESEPKRAKSVCQIEGRAEIEKASDLKDDKKEVDEKDYHPAVQYRIKLSTQSFLRLLERHEHHKKHRKKSSETLKTDDSSNSLNSINTVPETIFSDDLQKTLSEAVLTSCVRIENGNHLSAEHFYARAHDLKKKAVNERDRVMQVLMYFEAVAFYIMASNALASNPEKMYSSITETVNFLNTSWATFKNSKTVASSSSASYIRSRLKIVQMMISSCLAYQHYHIRCARALSIYTILQQYEKENPQNLKRPPSSEGMGGNSVGTSASSPAASTPSSNLSANSQQPMVSVPADIYTNMSQQIRTLHHLMWSHKLWNDAKALLSIENKPLFDALNTLCGELRNDSELVQVSEFLLTAICWLRKEYERMLENRGRGASTTVSKQSQ